MVKCSSTARLPSLEVNVVLAQTDTTVGFASQNEKQLYKIKSRKNTKPFLKVYASFKDFLQHGNRVPQQQKNYVRRSKKTTFIIKNRACRVAKSSLNSSILRNSTWHFSTSANEADKKFNREFCENKADIIIEDKCGLYEESSSSLIKINNNKRKKIR